MAPVVHCSPDGSDGNFSPDFSKITTAKEIVKRMWVEVR